MGVITATDYACKFKWDFIWFECDSTYMVELLQNKNTQVPWKFVARWNRAINYLSNITYKVSHIYREENQVADKLTSLATPNDEDT